MWLRTLMLPQEQSHENAQRTLVRIFVDGDHHPRLPDFHAWTSLQNGHLGLLMLALVVVAIMLRFHGVHADGHGHDLLFLRLLGRQQGTPERPVNSRWTSWCKRPMA